MTRGATITAAAAAAFLVVLVAQLPARWAAHALPRRIACSDLEGTVWNGGCAGLSVSGMPLGDLAWRVHPLRLLLLHLSAAIDLDGPDTRLSATVDLAPMGAGSAADVHATLPLDHRLLAQLPLSEHASLQANLTRLAWRGRRVTRLSGQVELRGLTFPSGEPLGDYQLSFPPATGGEPVGRIADLGGPLSVEGTLRLTPQPGFAVQALVAARSGTPADIAQGLRFLGSPDAQGRREFSFEGTF
ncbi:MAG TPA: type II secretion system protein N [Steroidobacteraceae bacterium]|nr:type II secretion system protein N [Steroidobacteraceae bacterium]